MNRRDERRVLVIGFGNSLRGDDGVGARVVERIAARRWSQTVTLTATQLVPELATVVASAAGVIFVDACVDQEAVEVRELTPACPLSRRIHDTGPRELLALARTCYGRAPSAWLVLVPGREFGFVEGLSAATERHADMAVREIESLVEMITAREVHHA